MMELSKSNNKLITILIGCAVTTFAFAGSALPELPTGGRINAGSATFNSNGNVMTVTTTSNRAVLGWDTFNIGNTATVHFQQPTSDSAVLNRITGGDVSSIQGTLNSNGAIYFVNPAGFVLGAGAQVSAPTFGISTVSGLTDADFMSGVNGVNGASAGVGLIQSNGTSSATLVVSNSIINIQSGSIQLTQSGQANLTGDNNISRGGVNISASNSGLSFSGNGGAVISTSSSSTNQHYLTATSGTVDPNINIKTTTTSATLVTTPVVKPINLPSSIVTSISQHLVADPLVNVGQAVNATRIHVDGGHISLGM